MSDVDVETGVVATSDQLTEGEARLLTGHIKNIAISVKEKLEKLAELIAIARDGGAAEALGYRSWTAYVEQEFGHTPLQLDREDRRELVVRLTGMGMATRAIAPVVGIDQKTVSNDLRAAGEESSSPDEGRRVTGRDGKTYKIPPRPRPLPPRPEPESASDMAKAIAERTRAAREAASQAGGGVEAGDVRDDHASSPDMPQPSPEAVERHEREQAAQISREVASNNLAKSVWLLGQLASMDEPVELILRDWQDHVDTYPEKTTADRMRSIAAFLNELAGRWPT